MSSETDTTCKSCGDPAAFRVEVRDHPYGQLVVVEYVCEGCVPSFKRSTPRPMLAFSREMPEEIQQIVRTWWAEHLTGPWRPQPEETTMPACPACRSGDCDVHMTMSDVHEAKIESTVVGYARGRQCMAPKIGMVGERGWPDRLFIAANGYTLWIEFKRRGEEPDDLQLAIIEKLRHHGQHVEVCDDVTQGKLLIDELVLAMPTNEALVGRSTEGD